MSSLKSITLQSPGTLGLNTQDADDVQDPRFCTQADNCVIAKNGLLESRKGFGKINSSAATGTPTLDVVYSYVEDDGDEFIISTGENSSNVHKIWRGTTTLTDVTGTITAATGDNWQFQNYAGEIFGYQSGHAPIFAPDGATAFADLSTHAGADGLVNSHCHLSAYGRSWVVDTTTVSQINYSDLLDPVDFTGGSSGSIDLNTVWPYSNDTITAMAAHNNNLIIFCEKSIIIYGSAHNINNIYLVEVIKDIGCIARDSVQNIGDDILFLSKDGVRSLARTVIQDNMPQKEISFQIRDDIIDSIAGETPSLIKSTYNEKEGFYVLNFPTVGVQWVCDVRKAQEGIFRWTKWNASIYGIATGIDNTLYGGLAGGWLSEYAEYYDTDTSDGSEDVTYVMKYRSGWIDSGLQTSKAIWKKMVWFILSLANISPSVTWAFDFLSDQEYSASKGITGAAPPVYGTATYGSATYGGDYVAGRYAFQMRSTGSLIKVGFQSVVGGGKFAFNKIDLFFKTGRIR